MKGTRVLFYVSLLIIGCAYKLSHAYEMTSEAIEERIKPFGTVKVSSDIQDEVQLLSATEQPAAESVSMNVDQTHEDGKLIYDQYCTICHASGVAGAPKFKDEADWQPRLDGGVDVLLEHATNGYNMMPPMGTCASCSQQQLKDAIEYMLPNS